MTKQEIRKTICLKAGFADKVSFSKKEGKTIFKRAYFYRHGQSAEGLLEKVMSLMCELGLHTTKETCEDKFASWPKTSYFVATVNILELE